MWQHAFLQICSVSARQGGLITAGQCRRLEIQPDSLANDGLLTLLDWDVYLVAGSAQDAVHDFPRAAWLALAPDRFGWERPQDAVVSHASAARLLGLGMPTAPVITFTAAHPREMLRATRLAVGTLTRDEVVDVAGVPVTSAQRTVLDLVAAGTDIGEVRTVITEAVLQDRLDLAELYRQLAPAAERFRLPGDGADLIAELLDPVDVERLSRRNRRAVAELALPAETALMASTLGSALPAVRPDIITELAAEAVLRSRHFSSPDISSASRARPDRS